VLPSCRRRPDHAVNDVKHKLNDLDRAAVQRVL
jgi:hypothetical protein